MSSIFDPNAKENKAILDYFENKTWLVVESSASARSSIKKTIMLLGSKLNNMIDTDNYKDAMELIETRRPHYILGNKNIAGGSTIALFESHVKKYPNRLNSGFFVLTEENSLSEVAIALNYDMDGIVSIPFTGATIINTLLSGIKHKVEPTPYIKKFSEAQEKFLKQEYDEALPLLLESLSLHQHPYEGHFFIGQVYREKNMLPEAVESYEKALAHNPVHYNTLKHLGFAYYQQKNFKKAYDINLAMAQSYPITPERIPELLRLSIINQKYSDINNYLRVFYSLQTPSLEVQHHLAAALAVLGKYFLNANEVEKGIDSLRTAFTYSNGKYEILKSVTKSFYEAKKADTLLEMFERTDTSTWPDTTEGFHFYTLHQASSDDNLIVTAGEKLLKKKVTNVFIYKGIVERAIRMKKKSNTVEGLINEAIKAFPDDKVELEDLLKKAKENG